MLFRKLLNESGRKPSTIWVDKGSELYNRIIKSWFQGNDIAICLTHNEEKSVAAERFSRTLKNKIYKLGHQKYS